ncbi:MAG: uroporphyrinogen decarboxylase [Bacteroidota bacterium]
MSERTETAAFPEMKNDLMLRMLAGEEVERPPVWMMRQAGRYLPDYMKLREKHSFFERCQTPELATEITVMPIDQVGTDAAIIFSDILTVPLAMGFDVTIEPGEGPRIHNKIESAKDVEKFRTPDVYDTLNYVFEALTMTRRALNGRVPLIGFAGAPWTIFCYCVNGRGSRDFATAKAFCYAEPDAAAQLMTAITHTTINYLNAQIEAGAQVVQVFDSWAGVLSPIDYQKFAMPYISAILKNVTGAPVIVFPKGAYHTLPNLVGSGAAALGVDWATAPETARAATQNEMVLQGNLDPAVLLGPPAEIERRTREMVSRFGVQKYIANLGHGILPNVKPDHARVFVDTVKSFGGG